MFNLASSFKNHPWQFKGMVLDHVLSLFFNTGILQHLIESSFRYFFRRVSAHRDEVIVVRMYVMFVPATSIFSPPMFFE